MAATGVFTRLASPGVTTRRAAPGGLCPRLLGPSCSPSAGTSRDVSVAAKRRLLDREYAFAEVYSVVTEKLRDRNMLPVRDTFQLIECIKTPEHAARCLDLIQAFLNMQSMMNVSVDSMDAMDGPQQPPVPTVAANGKELGPFLSDWHYRKRFLARIAEIAVLELGKPEIAFAIVANTARLRISTYFGKDLISQLGQYGQVPLEVLNQIASVVRSTRGPADKGTKAALKAVIAVMQDRGMSEETIASVRQVLVADRSASMSPPAPAMPVSQPAGQPVMA